MNPVRRVNFDRYKENCPLVDFAGLSSGSSINDYKSRGLKFESWVRPLKYSIGFFYRKILSKYASPKFNRVLLQSLRDHSITSLVLNPSDCVGAVVGLCERGSREYTCVRAH